MGSSALWLRFIALTVLFCCYSGSDHTNVHNGVFVRFKIPKPINEDEKVSFNFTTEDGYPELPSWLQLEQRTAEDPGYLYGAPQDLDKSATVEIIGWNKQDYSTTREIVEFHVTPNENGYPWFQAEFLITNVDFDKFLDQGNHTIIRTIVYNNYWNASDLVVTRVESALSRGGRIPLPNSNKHEGVYVRVGSHKKQSPAVEAVLQTGKKPTTDHFLMNRHNYHISWSNFRWIDLRSFPSLAAQRQALLPKDRIISTVDYVPPKLDDSARDFKHAFVLIVVIPIIVILVFVLLLSLIMCFGREGREKRDQETSHIQLTHHHNIQRSTLRLRELSKPADHGQPPSQTPPSQERGRPRHGHGEYERVPEELEDYGTDGRHVPPPYRMPPGGGTGGQQV